MKNILHCVLFLSLVLLSLANGDTPDVDQNVTKDQARKLLRRSSRSASFPVQEWFEESCYDPPSLYASKNFIVRVKTNLEVPPMLVPCQPSDGGWLVFMRRYDGRLDFNKNWEQYAEGFGDLLSEFWLGNRNLHAITSTNVYRLRVDMTTWEDKKYYAEYGSFRVSSEANKFMANVGLFDQSSTGGDSFTYGNFTHPHHQNGMAFSTPERDNDRTGGNCAEERSAGWWFNACQRTHPTGIYRDRNYRGYIAMRWATADNDRSMKEMTLKLKRVA